MLSVPSSSENGFLSAIRANYRLLLLSVVLLSGSGCCATQWCHLPDDCAHAFAHTQLGWEINDVCNCINGTPCGCASCVDISCGDTSCGVRVYDDAVVIEEPCCDSPCYAEANCRPRVKVGPPPVSYVPPMPPKFLPVPARSVFSNVNVNAPTVSYGQVEVGYGHELQFPAGD